MTSKAASATKTALVPPVLFQGSPSQSINAPTLLVAFIMFAGVFWSRVAMHAPHLLLLGPIVAVVALVFYRFLRTATISYTVDAERIHVRRGVLLRKITSLELFRVQDVTLYQSWWQDLLGIGTIVVDSSDLVTPRLVMLGVPDPVAFRDDLNKSAIALRDRKGIREVNYGRV
ncbi:MAG: hypothetical protein BGO50_10595 [Rhodanobacter sp. 67-28]|nr:MAG: hypothetical protein BGO50_10595 [Rhodanobacter sp. 67-28]